MSPARWCSGALSWCSARLRSQDSPICGTQPVARPSIASAPLRAGRGEAEIEDECGRRWRALEREMKQPSWSYRWPQNRSEAEENEGSGTETNRRESELRLTCTRGMWPGPTDHTLPVRSEPLPGRLRAIYRCEIAPSLPRPISHRSAIFSLPGDTTRNRFSHSGAPRALREHTFHGELRLFRLFRRTTGETVMSRMF